MRAYLKKGKLVLCRNNRAGSVKWLEEPNNKFSLLTFSEGDIALQLPEEEIKLVILHGLESLVVDQSFVNDVDLIELHWIREETDALH